MRSLFLVFLFKVFLIYPPLSRAATPSQPYWKIAIVFLNDEADPELTKSIQKNLKEISVLKKDFLQSINEIQILQVSYQSDQHQDKHRHKIAAQLQKQIRDFYVTPKKDKELVKKLLIFYGHGNGAYGMGPFTTDELKRILVPVDLLWMDACFMANTEFAYELRHFYSYLLASQDSELSSGIPYKTLSVLNHTASTQTAAFQLAEAFMLSYSKQKKGSQNESVIESATTISVIESEAWPIFMKYFRKNWKKIKSLLKTKPETFKRSQIYFTMDDPHWIDLGTLSRLWGSTDLAELLDVQEVKKARLNREYDYVFLKSTQSDNPVKLLGYTLKINGHTKTYTGLNIFNPLFGDLFIIPEPKLYKF